MSTIFMAIILLVLSIAPVIALGAIIYKFDFDKEPTLTLIKLFICGICSTFLTLTVTWGLSLFIPFFSADISSLNLIELIPAIFIGVGLIEEFSKWIFVYALEYNDREFNHLYDGIVYATFVSLGFACLENILYVFQSGIGTAIMRAFISIPGHLCFGVMMGYYLSLAKLAFINKNKKLSKRNLILSILIPTLAHGLFDYLIYASTIVDSDFLSMGFTFLFYAFIIAYFIYCSRKVVQFSKNKYNLNPGYVKSYPQRPINYGYYNNSYPQYPINNNTYNNSYPQPMSNSYYNNSYSQPINNGYNNNPQQLVNNNIETIVKSKYCMNCGTKVVGKFCPNCGNKIM